MTNDRARLAALEGAVARLNAQQDPQAQRDAGEYTWDPRGLADELLVQDSTGAPLTRRKTIQFTGTATDDPLGRRTIVDTAGVPFVLTGARAAMGPQTYSPSTVGSAGDAFIVPIPALTLTVTVPAGPSVPVMFAAHLRYLPSGVSSDFFNVLLDPGVPGSGRVYATATAQSASRFGVPGTNQFHVFTAPPGTPSVSSGAAALSSGIAIVTADATPGAPCVLGSAVAIPVLVTPGTHTLALGCSSTLPLLVRNGYAWAQ